MYKASSSSTYKLIRCCPARLPDLAAGSRTPGDRQPRAPSPIVAKAGVALKDIEVRPGRVSQASTGVTRLHPVWEQ